MGDVIDFRKRPKVINAQEALDRWTIATKCGDTAAALRAQAEYYQATLGDWPSEDKPCDV